MVDQIIKCGQFTIQDGVKPNSCDVKRVVKWVKRVDIPEVLAEKLRRMFQKDTMPKFLLLIQLDIAERWGQNTDTIIVMEFIKSGYVIGGFEPKLMHCNGERILVQELRCIVNNCNRYLEWLSLKLGRNCGTALSWFPEVGRT